MKSCCHFCQKICLLNAEPVSEKKLWLYSRPTILPMNHIDSQHLVAIRVSNRGVDVVIVQHGS